MRKVMWYNASMPKKTALVDYQACRPELCEEGICRAAQTCPRRVLKQEEPYEAPSSLGALCVGCAQCVAACLAQAVRMTIT
jgi:Fe-S-cluster-containing hydrogenase component 2